MSTYNYQAVIVVTSYRSLAYKAQKIAKSSGLLVVTGVKSGTHNGTFSFAVLPNGQKVGGAADARISLALGSMCLNFHKLSQKRPFIYMKTESGEC